MRIKLKNIAKVKTADIDINGITVIAGDNNTGKSTIGKALFSVFNGLNDVESKHFEDKYKSLVNAINKLHLYLHYEHIRYKTSLKSDDFNVHESNVINDLLSISSNDPDLELKIELVLKRNFNYAALENNELDFWADVINEIKAILKIDTNKYINYLISEQFRNEFNRQIVNIFEESSGVVHVELGKQNIIIDVDSDNTVSINNFSWNDIKVEPIYIDNPFIIDDVFRGPFVDFSTYKNHRRNLLSQLITNKSINQIDSIINSNKLNRIMDSINEIIPGEIDLSEGGLSYVYNQKRLDVKNLSTGIKTFAILKRLILGGYISTKGILILDEPEIHLHPEWQLVLAELIVLLQREFNLYILITTHSPYFLNAIEVYVAKHNINDKCKYYLSKFVENSESVTFYDVSDEIDLIYKKLVKPLQQLENLRYRL